MHDLSYLNLCPDQKSAIYNGIMIGETLISRYLPGPCFFVNPSRILANPGAAVACRTHFLIPILQIQLVLHQSSTIFNYFEDIITDYHMNICCHRLYAKKPSMTNDAFPLPVRHPQ